MGCASGMIKYLVFIFNLVFFLVGLGFLILGVLYTVNFNDATNSLPDDSTTLKLAPVSIIIIGSIIVIISFFGCCGAIKESSCMLTTYACILLAILIVQVAIGVYALIQIKNEDDLQISIRKQLQKTKDRYYQDVLSRESFDTLQTAFQCCGVNNKDDWRPRGIPASCCKTNEQICNEVHAYDKGCTVMVSEFIKRSIKIIGIILLALTVTEVLASIFALCLSSSIKSVDRRRHY